MQIKLFLALLVTTISTNINSSSWDNSLYGGSEHKKLKGLVILDVGEIEEKQPPKNIKRINQFYSLNDSCFEIYDSDYEGPGFLLEDKSGVKFIALIKEKYTGGFKISLEEITEVDCNGKQGYLNLREKIKRNEEMLRRLLENAEKNHKHTRH